MVQKIVSFEMNVLNKLHFLFIIIISVLYFSHTKIVAGRPVWYYPKKLWTSSLGGQNNDSSQQLFDIYTLTHVSHGIIFYSLLCNVCNLSPMVAIGLSMIIEIIWELVENSNYIINKYRKTTVSRNYLGDSWINSIGDIWGTYIGILIAMNTSLSSQFIFIIFLEAFLYLLQGDNLLTNVITIFRKSENFSMSQKEKHSKFNSLNVLNVF